MTAPQPPPPVVRTRYSGLGVRHRPQPTGAVPVLLVHGLASNARLWDPVATCLAAEGYEVAAVDLRGHGSSAEVPDPPDRDPIDMAVSDLVAVCTELGWRRVLVAGQSWGGNIVVQLAAECPELVAGLALVDGGWLHLGDQWSDVDEAWPTLAPPNLADWTLDDLREVLTDAHEDWSAEAVEANLANLEQLPDGTVRPWLTLDRHRARVASLLRHTPRALYPRVRCPAVLLAAGDPPDPGAAEAAAALPDATLVTFRDGDHDLHAQYPDRVAAAVASLLGWVRPVEVPRQLSAELTEKVTREMSAKMSGELSEPRR